MTIPVLTETALLAALGLVVGCILKMQTTSQTSRCERIDVCCGLFRCHRENLSGEQVVELRELQASTHAPTSAPIGALQGAP